MTNPSHKKEVWASGAAYEPYVGRWSRLVARMFLNWLAIPPGKRFPLCQPKPLAIHLIARAWAVRGARV
ncbi:MAG TPA: hypothetical protein VKP04_05855 [Ktedonobacteraceae bacterium]|nr:hypothetical protein [Ktedonobacteraceae bacterium]